MKLSQILESNEDVTVVGPLKSPWGEVHVRTLSGDARDRLDGRFGEAQKHPERLIGFRGWVVGLSLCDAQGNQDTVLDNELDALGKKDGSALTDLFVECSKISKLSTEDTIEAVKE